MGAGVGGVTSVYGVLCLLHPHTLFHWKCYCPTLKIRKQVSERLGGFHKSSSSNQQRLDSNSDFLTPKSALCNLMANESKHPGGGRNSSTLCRESPGPFVHPQHTHLCVRSLRSLGTQLHESQSLTCIVLKLYLMSPKDVTVTISCGAIHAEMLHKRTCGILPVFPTL